MKESVPYKNESGYKAWKSVVKIALNFPLEDYEEKSKKLHRKRLVRKMLKGKASSKEILKASMQEVSTRSDLVTMVIEARKIQYNLSTANKACRDFLNSKIYLKGKTQAERASEISRIIKKGLDRESEFKAFLDSIEYIIADIDKAAWNLKLQRESLEMVSKPEMVL